MIFRFFKQPLPQVLAVIILLTIGLWFKSFLNPNPNGFYFDEIKMPFYQILTDILPDSYFYKILLTFFIFLFTGLYLLQINSKYIIIKNRTYLPVFIFSLLISGIPSLQQINPAIFATLLLAFSFDQIFSIYHKNDALNNLFKAGFFIALASLFYTPSALYILPVLLSIVSLRTFNFREIITALTGFITPWFLYSFYYFFFRDNWSFGVELFKENLLFSIDNHWKSNFFIYLYTGYFLLLFLVSGIFLIRSLESQKIFVRKYFGVFYWFNLVTLLIVLFIPGRSFEVICLFSIPLAFQFAYYFTLSARKFWPSLFFYIMLVIVFLIQFLPERLVSGG